MGGLRRGFAYLATVIDCHTKACIGYAIAEHMRAELVIDALHMAAWNYALADGAIYHSYRGTQYLRNILARRSPRPPQTQGRFKIHNADPLLSRRREFRAD